MTLELLISCMNQKDMTLVQNSRVTTDALLVNQCDSNSIQMEQMISQTIRMISTTERGLSNSRNMAILNATGDICLFCDNDEIFEENYAKTILKAFNKLKNADIIIFDISGCPCRFKKKMHSLKYLELLHVVSYQIAFRREAVIKSGVLFDPLMGAGSGNGAQEENHFLIQCKKAGLQIYYVPKNIGTVKAQESTWFHGFNTAFFYQRGGATRRMLGLPISVMYAVYYAVVKWKMYSHEISFPSALLSSIKGCIDNPIEKQRRIL